MNMENWIGIQKSVRCLWISGKNCAYTQSFLFSELNERNMEKKEVAKWKQDFTSSALGNIVWHRYKVNVSCKNIAILLWNTAL